MAAFDRARWLKRIRSKLARRGEVHKVEALVSHARNYAAIDGLEKVTAWAKKKHITVEFIRVSVGRFHSQSRRVEISTHLQPEVQLHTLLHELGHFLIEDLGPEVVAYRFPNGYRKIDNQEPGRDILHKVDVLAEEFEAWERGRELAKKLNIDVDRDAFDRDRARYLQTYFRWALKRGRVSDGD